MGKRVREETATSTASSSAVAASPAAVSASDDHFWWHVSETEWYEQTIKHWSQQSGLDGVLGGCSEIDEIDAGASLQFLSESRLQLPRDGLRALECGAGVGRVTSSVLLRACETVHLVEVSPPLIEQARENLSRFSGRVSFERVSLQEFAPKEGARFELVWLQWVLGHLTDTSVVRLLRQCRHALSAGGVIVLKENTAPRSECKAGRGRYMVDEANAAVIRNHQHMLTLCQAAGLTVMRSKPQTGLPKDYYPVRMYELAVTEAES